MVDTILEIKNGEVVRAFHLIKEIGWIEEKLPNPKMEQN